MCRQVENISFQAVATYFQTFWLLLLSLLIFSVKNTTHNLLSVIREGRDI